MEHQFKSGDVVKLKSGGSSMTVESINEEDRQYVTCVWHEGKKPYREVYLASTLEPYKQGVAAIGPLRL
ncbi:YodC family protein [Chitiniphilus eburneus]|uniref:DUF2158 domain-containing protein n=1 Tax=Chitiniphilus eburneus TaxID=2571148 RepID=A0A4U0PK73_9NEIS|nr:DUF2158 domain-containing protein [Chitiniphilus eburneus]TJZ68375.1 DUF2158 domain-containing protein [Chitiniphilus eburneus]